MKRIPCMIITCILLFLCVVPVNVSATTHAPARVINVVYDDSGSMYSGVDTWCRAKYSMEVFSAMLGDTDKMNVYYMSDYRAGSSVPPRISLDGADGSDVNVAKIHNQKTTANNTPFNAVKKAYADLDVAAADEKWLIILTDGEFEDGRMSSSEIDSFLANKSQDIKVMFLGMGQNAAGITEDIASNIFYVEAKTNAQILNRITEICTRVFNSNKLELNVSAKTCSFDVPMAELTVFAQGANVEIAGIKRSDGSLVQSSKTPVEVKYSECDATNYSNQPVTDLLGKIATFKDDFPAGDYAVEVSGAETVEIYYKPNIAVAAYLTDSTGQSVTNLSNLAAGEYTISFGFVKAGTSDPVAASTLLGDVSYEAVVTNNGVTHEKVYSNGDKIQIEEGPLAIDVTAHLLTMVIRPVSDDEVLQELHLAGIETDDAFGALGKLLHKYTFADNSVFTVHSIRTTVDEFTTISSCVYTITDEAFDKFFSDSLRNAYFILEDEKNEESYIDAKLFNHVTQVILPGQFVTYDGKYYAAKYVSPQSGVVLRRASDLYGGRKYYRQIRRYVFDGEQDNIIWQRKVGDIEFAEIQIDFHVDTSGYLEMADSHNLRTAKVIDFSEDPTVEYYSRKYHNKSVLRIKLPDSDEKIRFTICLLLSEIFKTVFPDGWQYIAVSTRQPDDIGGMLNYMLYKLDGAFEDGYIYVIEDSSIDLGLLSAIEKNFTKLMEIAADFLDWHYEKMREPASKDPVPVKISVAEAAEKKKRNLIVRMLDRIRKLFNAGEPSERVEIPSAEKVEAETQKEHTGSGAEELEEAAPTASGGYDLDQTVQQEKTEESELAPVAGNGTSEYSLDEDDEALAAPNSEVTDVTPASSHGQEEAHLEDEFQPTEENDPDLVAIDGTDIFDNEGMPEDNDYLESSFVAMGLTPITKSRYQRECFLKFGFEEIDGRIQVDAVRKYLRVRGWSNNSLTLARKREVLARTEMDLTAVNHCDFCGLPLSGVSYERLNDGRVRCNDCSSSAIAKPDDFRELFYRTLGMMEDFFEIRYRVPIRVKMADARTVAKGAGMIFKPSTGVAPRVLGFAQRKNGKYSLLVENGSPRLATIDTMVHEMAHIWQYLNWDDKQIASIYGMNDASCSGIARDIVYEGMAMWASIQYLYQIGETFYAMQQETLAETRQDVYGIGFRLYQEQYPLVKDSSLLKYSPFSSFPTLEPSAVQAAVKSRCTKKECKC